ncbi:PTS system beta-glucosides-specific IIC component [Breznakia blatticola]|uniref:PTS system beta-glucosides-specific IIC component n=1 Tax=Breznakia blatticola TaxID=1754012 RepID=A0A4R7ZFQ9_9FIRM|nr:PTS transporter subunit EIIC [Breznakia blatticola]TDW16449.1 PTS system beta-glucosides-specific IIC component [Breznakia blatticola]
MKYENMSKEILSIIKKENIADVFYCVTRLRIVVKNKEEIDQEALAKINGILQVKQVGNQFQLVIGSHVKDVYNDFCEVAGFSNDDSGEQQVVANEDTQKESLGTRFLSTLSGIFLPLLPILIAGGMLKSFVIILLLFNTELVDSGVVTVLNSIGDAPFYFLPFMVGYTTAKRFKINEMYGLMIAGVLLSPTFMGAAGDTIDFILFNIPAQNYASSVVPVILSVILFSYAFRFIDSIMPKAIKIVFSGFLTFLIVMPILLFIVAPFGYYLGESFSQAIVWLFETTGPIAGALTGGLMSFIIITGMHQALQPLMIVNYASLGYDFLMPGFFVNNIAVAGATLGAAFKIKDPDNKAAAFSGGGLGLLGITEPALYSVDIEYRTPLIGIVAGGAAGGFLYMLFGVKSYGYAMPGIFSLPTYIGEGNNLIFMIISLVVAFVVAFLVSFVLTKDKSVATKA